MTQREPQAVKQEQEAIWNGAAAGWRKNDDSLRERTEPVSQKLLELAGIGAGHRVLDIASGTGEPGLPAAHVVGPTGSVLLTDIARNMLDVARDKARQQSLDNVSFRVVDGEDPDVGEEEFNAAICRFGVMFMPEPVRCLRAVHRALVPGGRMAVAVWGPPPLNPFISVTIPILAKYVEIAPPSPGEPGIFAFAQRDRLAQVYADAGFRDIAVEDLEIVGAEFDTGREYWQVTREIAGPIAKMFEQVPDDMKEKVTDEIASAASGAGPESPVSLRGTALLAVGTK